MLTTVRRSRPKGPLRAVPGATNNRKIGGRLCYCDNFVLRRAFANVRLKGFEPSQLAIEASLFSSFHTREMEIERSVD